MALALTKLHAGCASSAVASRRARLGCLPPGLAAAPAAAAPLQRATRPARRAAPLARGAAKQHLYTAAPGALDAPSPGFDSIAAALEDLAAGKFVVVLDDEDRENEGDLIIAGDKVTTEAMAFMVEFTSGVICIALPGADLDRLRLPLMVDSRENDESMYTAFTVTVDLRHGTTTGISAADRAATIRALSDPAASADAFRRPGHIFPLRYRDGGVIVRPGHTEAAVDLSRLAGCSPAGVLCEIVDKDDGSMQRTPQLLAFAAAHGLKCITIADLIRYRLRHEQLLQPVSSAPLHTRHGDFVAHVFRSAVDGKEHAALTCGAVGQQQKQQRQQQQQQQAGGVLAAVHAQSSLVDVFGSLHCGREGFLDGALAALAAEGEGVLLYVSPHQDGSDDGGSGAGGVASGGMAAELEAYARQQRACSANGAGASGRASPLADLRDAAAAAHMLRHLGVGSVRLLSDRDADAQRLGAFGVEVAGLAGGAAAAAGAGGGSGGGAALNGAAHAPGGGAFGARRPTAAV
ncbi:bifunctional riboflavin biosynthesis protein, chloroplastic [Raphidocelis subcapitata]|uniref:3,4-dihydroxy-2-butanone-4-phosphate synthase n=1 Tax=Raphidocelis subcapitata TaxID=307507 RepID=A0A2V0NTS9_9CHLO|nr:bifunctional riboflavin biosynthesis protein, chloroplastic [Raphidocelis subcapitata]|eukprot:GBF88953.1 bifunctional riboflavin biosynthesis protein, chloroplastic [Raphidocelis subcapitata]